MRGNSHSGFTLIELSIVLVIIGLIVGGVLVGQDLIAAAALQAQIKQIQAYNTAVNTFRIKYGYLPGDIPDPQASSIGLQARGRYAGEGDGNGLIEGVVFDMAGVNNGWFMAAGEVLAFWTDLSTANLIGNGFHTGSTSTIISGTLTTNSHPSIADYMPNSKLRGGVYVYAWSGGWNSTASDGINYFGLSKVDKLDSYPYQTGGLPPFDQGLTVMQAYNIDTKVDDGLPMSGTVIALYDNAQPVWGGGIFATGPFTTALAASSLTCFDNNNVVGMMHYSTSVTKTTFFNCALSFRFQ